MRWFSLLFLLLLIVGCGESAEMTPPPLADTPIIPTNTPEPTPDPLDTGTDGNPWWNDIVFYEVFVRSFYDSDGDGVGDLNGLIEKLDYINDGDPATSDDLGATGIWLMPIAVSPSYHGYDVTDYFQVDPEYGTNDDFKRLMEEAHARGIRVIVDLVLNHTSTQHPWFIESKDPNSDRRDWYVWEDDDPGYRGPSGQPAWHSSGGDYYYGVFWSGMPDLNLENAAVTQEMYRAVDFWLNELGVDGFRLDAIKHLIEEGQGQENTPSTHEWLQAFHEYYKSVDPHAFTVGEAWTGTQQVVRYTGNEVDVAFQFDLALDILNASDAGLAPLISKTQAEVYEAFPANQYATFITNHDQDRVMSQLDGEVDKAKLAASILLTSPGIPFIYYGEEIGMSGGKPDEDIRRPMQWTGENGVGFTTGTAWRAPADDFPEVNVAAADDDPNSLLNHYRSLINLRNNHAALRVGEWSLVESNSGRIYAFLRHTEDETILVLINLSRQGVNADQYALEIESSALRGAVGATSLYGLAEPIAPTVDSAGGFADYVPFSEIAPRSTHIVQLSSP